MRASFLAILAALLLVASGCSTLNIARRSSNESCTADASCSKAADAVPCAKPVGCAQPVGCAKPIGCTAAVSPAVPPLAGVSPAVPPIAGVSPYVPAAAPYDPGYGSRGRVPHFPAHRTGGGGGAVIAYPYYTIRGPRDFLLDNPPSIGR